MDALKDKFLKNSASNVNLNSYGHRCKELSDVNLHNYILFAGDNVCLSYHLPIEETFPYLVAKKLNTDYYNLSVFNGGIDGIRYNLFTWLFNIPKPPKAIIFSAEFANAILIADSSLSSVSVPNYDDDNIKLVLETSDVTGFHTSRQLLFSNLLKQLNYPMYQIVFNNKEKLTLAGNVINLEFNEDIFDQTSITDIVVNTLQVRSTRIKP
jgi:hypothetical protein